MSIFGVKYLNLVTFWHLEHRIFSCIIYNSFQTTELASFSY